MHVLFALLPISIAMYVIIRNFESSNLAMDSLFLGHSIEILATVNLPNQVIL